METIHLSPIEDSTFDVPVVADNFKIVFDAIEIWDYMKSLESSESTDSLFDNLREWLKTNAIKSLVHNKVTISPEDEVWTSFCNDDEFHKYFHRGAIRAISMSCSECIIESLKKK